MKRSFRSQFKNAVIAKWAVAIPSNVVDATTVNVTIHAGESIKIAPRDRSPVTVVVEQITSEHIALRADGHSYSEIRAGDWATLDSKTALELESWEPATGIASIRLLTVNEAVLHTLPIEVEFEKRVILGKDVLIVFAQEVAERAKTLDETMSKLTTCLFTCGLEPQGQTAKVAMGVVADLGSRSVSALRARNMTLYDSLRKQLLLTLVRLRLDLGITNSAVQSLLAYADGVAEVPGSNPGHSRGASQAGGDGSVISREVDVERQELNPVGLPLEVYTLIESALKAAELPVSPRKSDG